MAKNKSTKHEHYVPQFYLRQFSPDGNLIYQYDVISCAQTLKPVPIKSICYENDLYEFRDNSGEIIRKNLIEKSFSELERKFASVFRSIQSKAQYEANYQTRSFLSSEEKAFLIFFLSTIIIRSPDVLQAAQETTMEFFEDWITETSARNLALKTCLPIYKTLNAEERNPLNSAVRLISNKSFQIGATDKDVFWTSDSPVIIYGSNQPANIDKIIMPISPHLALYMKPYENTKNGFYNRLVKLDKKDVEYINSSVVTHCKRWIYSNAPLTSSQIKWISKERNQI